MRNLVERVRGIRAYVKNAKKAADEIVDQYGERAMTRVGELEDQALSKKGILEFFYWKLVREYVRDIEKARQKNS
ncbi:MAG: hypothetical protein KGZ73_06745 [Rhizobiales bacterium]|nr:hypothetical protein [Hyphomicrobiales bacterium]